MLSAIRAIIIFAPWVLWLLIVDMLLSFMLPLSFVVPDPVYEASSFLANAVWQWLQAIFVTFNGAVIVETGDKLPQGESAIVIANHVSWGDIFMIQALAIKAQMLGRCRYFAKRELKWVPFLGWGLWAIGMPLVSRNWLQDQKELDRVFAGIVHNRWPTWLISYSEGTRFSQKKCDEAKAWCKEQDKPMPQHLLYPRTKGFVTTVQHLRQARNVKAVYDISIAYQTQGKFRVAPTMWEILRGPDLSPAKGYRFHVHVQRFPLEDFPEKDADIAKWLEQRWLQKGEWLESKRLEWSQTK